MKYRIVFSTDAQNDIKEFEKAGNKPALKKIDSFLEELEEHPRNGT
jgi:mRNA-degrading endonuclease RelE of RelBE toxin-antitoxin system